MFYLFGVGGLVWLLAWLSLYSEKRSTSDLEEEFIEPPKVGYEYFFSSIVLFRCKGKFFLESVQVKRGMPFVKYVLFKPNALQLGKGHHKGMCKLFISIYFFSNRILYTGKQ